LNNYLADDQIREILHFQKKRVRKSAKEKVILSFESNRISLIYMKSYGIRWVDGTS